jgi:hypothetical protein
MNRRGNSSSNSKKYAKKKEIRENVTCSPRNALITRQPSVLKKNLLFKLWHYIFFFFFFFWFLLSNRRYMLRYNPVKLLGSNIVIYV